MINKELSSDSEEDEKSLEQVSSTSSKKLKHWRQPGISLKKLTDEDFKPRKDESGMETWRDPDRPYVFLTKCNICGKIMRKQNIVYHKAFHARVIEKSKTKSFHCPICHLGLKDRWKLRKHFIIHLENNPFRCTFPECETRRAGTISGNIFKGTTMKPRSPAESSE